ncbi:acyltransferase [bacterium]|nr:acyltransferase [bacterium]
MASWQPPDRPELPAVTGIRFFAAMHVCLYHLAQISFAITYYGREDTEHFRTWAENVWAVFDSHWVINHLVRGALSQVGMFFVMSGFILTYSYPIPPTGAFNYRSYCLSRFARVYATYLAGLIWGIPLLLFVLSGEPERLREENTRNGIPEPRATETASGLRVTPLPPEFSNSPIERALATISVPLLLQAWYPKFSIFMWNAPAWSLSVEAFLYGMFPLLILRLVHWRTRSLIVLSLFCWVAMLIPPLWYIRTDPDNTGVIDWNMVTFWFNFVRHNPLLRLPEFMIGMIVARLFADQAAANARSGKATGGWMSTIAVTIAILTMIFLEEIIGHDAAYMLQHNGLLAPVYALGCAGLALGGGPVAFICSFRWMVILGDCAYGIYLFHFPWLAYMIGFLSIKSKEDPNMELPSAWNFIFWYLAVTIAAAVYFRLKMEKKLRFRIRDFVARLWPEKSKSPVTTPTA